MADFARSARWGELERDAGQLLRRGNPPCAVSWMFAISRLPLAPSAWAAFVLVCVPVPDFEEDDEDGRDTKWELLGSRYAKGFLPSQE